MPIVVTDLIDTSSPSDTYATQLANKGKGGHHNVADVTARNAITTERREFGMTAALQSDGKLYMLKNIAMGGVSDTLTDNANWIEFTGGGGGTVSTLTDRITGDGSGGNPITTSDGVLTPWIWTTGNITAFPTSPPKQAYEVDSTGIYLDSLPSGLTDGLEVTLYATAGVPININYNLPTPPTGTARIEATQTAFVAQRTDRIEFPDMITLKYVAIDNIWTVKSRTPRYPINSDIQEFNRGVGRTPIGNTAGIGENTLIERNQFVYTSVLSEGSGNVFVTTDFHGCTIVCDDDTCNQIFLPDFDTQSAENLFDGWKVHVRVLDTAMGFESLNPSKVFDTTGSQNEVSIQNFTDYTITFDRTASIWRFSAYSRYFLNNSLTLNSIPFWNGSGLAPSQAIATSSNGRLSLLDQDCRVSPDVSTVMVGVERAAGAFIQQNRTTKSGIFYNGTPIWERNFVAFNAGVSTGVGSAFSTTGTAAIVLNDPDNGAVQSIATAATTNASASLQGGTANFRTPNSPSGVLSNGWMAIFTIRPADASYGNGTTGFRLRLGVGSNLTEADWTGANTVPTTLLGGFISFCTDNSPTNWEYQERRSSTQSSGLVSTGLPFIPQNTYRIFMSAENQSDTVQFQIINLTTGARSAVLNGNSFQAWTANATMKPGIFMRTLSNAARTLHISTVFCQYGMKYLG